MALVDTANNSYTALAMDRDMPLGNSPDKYSRRSLHVRVSNDVDDPVQITGTVTSGQLPLTLGQKPMAQSISVAIASDQSNVPVTVSNFPAIQPVSQSGAWTTGRTWTIANTTDSVTSYQGGTWTTGRTWILSNSTDSVAAVQSGTWTTGRTWNLAAASDSVSSWTKDGAGNSISSYLNLNATSRALYALAVDNSTTGTFSSGASKITIDLTGLNSAGFQITAGTFRGTIKARCSIDGGLTYQDTTFYDRPNSARISSVTFASNNTTKILDVELNSGSSHVEVYVSSFTSGSAPTVLRASNVTSTIGSVVSAAYSTLTVSSVTLTGGVATLVIAANVNRKYASVNNNSGSTITFQGGTSTGLGANSGKSLTSKAFYEYRGDNLYLGNIYAFSTLGATITVEEGTP